MTVAAVLSLFIMTMIFKDDNGEYRIVSGERVTLHSWLKNTEHVEVPSDVSHKGKRYSIVGTEKFAFGKKVIESISFPPDSHVEEIGYASLAKTNLQRIFVPNLVKFVDPLYFNSKVQLIFNDNQTKFLSVSEDGCLYMKNPLKLLNGKRKLSKFKGIFIRETITTVGAFAYNKVLSLTWINFPSSITKICEYAFSDCFNLRSITFTEPSKLQVIESYAFSGDRGRSLPLKKITIPSSVKLIQKCAFQSCSLSRLVFKHDSDLEEIEHYSFSYNRLVCVSFPASLKKIGSYAFCCNKNLKRIVFPSDSLIEIIGNDSFSDTKFSEIECFDNNLLKTLKSFIPRPKCLLSK